jgi:hypothetical protein
MTPAETAAARAALDAASRPTPSCLPFDRLGGDLTATEREHVSGCARCQTELTLFAELNDPAPAAGEGAAVQWVVAELRRRRSHASADRRSGSAGWRVLRLPGLLAAAAAAVFVLAVGYVAWDREPRSRPARCRRLSHAQLQVLAPSGDVRAAPRDLEWSPVDGAASYDVVVLEVDRTVLWQGASTTARSRCPGRWWHGSNQARRSCGKSPRGIAPMLAVSGTGRFRSRSAHDLSEH